MKHTPGPWKLIKDEDAEKYTVTTKDGKPTIHRMLATVTFGYSEPAETEQHANAKLIAAAPELLEALGEVLPLIKYTDDAGWDKVKRARIAYKKATK